MEEFKHTDIDVFDVYAEPDCADILLEFTDTPFEYPSIEDIESTCRQATLDVLLNY